MFNLQHASRSLIDKNYHNAIKLYKTALNKIEKAKVCLCASPLPLLNVIQFVLVTLLHMLCMACCAFCSYYLYLFIIVFCPSTIIVCHRDPCVCHPAQTQWRSIMSTLEHNQLMVTIHYCLGIAVWHQHHEDYIVIAMTHFRIITTRYSSVIFVPAYYHLGIANAALHQ